MSEDPLTFAMDRGSIWKQGLTLLQSAGLEFTVGDVVDLAEFLAGDNIPSTTIIDVTQPESGGSDDQSANGSPEGAE